MYEVLKQNSVLLLGERHLNKIVWVQLYSTEEHEEEELRKLLLELNVRIMNKRIKSGSARKFLDGKLLFYEIDRVPGEITRNKILCLYTQEQNIDRSVKKAMQTIGYRGGAFSVYSAERFFNEMVDLLDDPEKLNYSDVPLSEAIQKIDTFDPKVMSANELGQLIHLINRSLEMDHQTIEKLYFLVYETIAALDEFDSKEEIIANDPDELLDSAYVIARKYQETESFYLALELYKKILPFANQNHRWDLETACRIKIATIYKKDFPNPGEYIIDTLSEIDKYTHLSQTSRSNREIYYCLMGYAYHELGKHDKAIIEYKKAIEEAKGVISSPIWIADAYSVLAKHACNDFLYAEASRQYLTAAAIAFSAGNVTIADNYRNQAGLVEIEQSYSLVHMALIHRAETNYREAEYRGWESLRSLLKSLQHIKSQHIVEIEELCQSIINNSKIVLSIEGKTRRNKTIIRRVEKVFHEMRDFKVKSKQITKKLEEVVEYVQSNIPMPPPTFMLLTLDGRLILMGEIREENWEQSDIEGVLLSGILSAIMSLITEVTDQETSLRTVDAGNLQIMLEQSKNLAGVILVDRENPSLRQNLITLLSKIDNKHGGDLRYWDGFVDPNLHEELITDAIGQFANFN